MAQLDRLRDFGVIMGDDQGRMFEQDGNYFTGDGEQWAEPAARSTRKAPAAPAMPAQGGDDNKAQLDAQLKA